MYMYVYGVGSVKTQQWKIIIISLQRINADVPLYVVYGSFFSQVFVIHDGDLKSEKYLCDCWWTMLVDCAI